MGCDSAARGRAMLTRGRCLGRLLWLDILQRNLAGWWQVPRGLKLDKFQDNGGI